ncbi:hypothetical protein AB0B15_14040 [Streptomyces sp. NPDC045456]|uniref:hypothetical protein n=1 Tax=Streptomyces sp. NPDC045456 TaxID=3155254 RepID=UPI0033D1C10A
MSARDDLLYLFLNGGPGTQPEFEAALDRRDAEVLREAADVVDAVDAPASWSADARATWIAAVSTAAHRLRRMTDEAGESDA